MIIPLDQLSSETLTAIIEEFVLRDDSQFSTDDMNKAANIAQVKQQLEQGSAVIVYSELYESINILPSDQFKEGDETP